MTENERVGWHHQHNKLGEIVKDGEDWHVAVCGVSKSRIQLDD